MSVLLSSVVDGHETGFDPAQPLATRVVFVDRERLAVCREDER
jgi:hypothetical protein